MTARTLLIAASTLGCAACVLPKLDVSGAELSWFSAEQNTVDGGDARRVRSCEGSLMTTVVFKISDLTEDDRSKRFSWSCADGYRTPAQFFTGASDVFVDLRPGSYGMTVASVDDPALRGADGDPMTLSEDEDMVAIGSDDATLIQWELAPVPLTLELDLAGTQSCESVNASLVYADAAAAVPDLPEDIEEPLVYRRMLRTQGGWALGGELTACADLTDGLDVVLGVDRGAYALEIQVDGQTTCRIELTVDGRQPPVVLDLADLPC